MSTFLMTAIFLLLATSGTLFVYNALPDFQRINMDRKFVDELGAGREAPGLLKIFRLPIVIFTDLAQSLRLPRTRIRYRADLESLGLERVVTADQLIALKLTLVFIFGLYGVMLMAVLPPFFCALLAVFGWFFVDIWLKDRITARKKQIRAGLPFVLDMLTLSVEAGLEFNSGMEKIVSRMAPSPLRVELTIYLRQVQMGMSRKEALRDLANRVQLQPLSSFVSALIQAAEMGSSVGGALRTQSEIMMSERFVQAEKKGAEASQKMLLPMVIFVIPAVMLVIIGPLLVNFIYHKGGF
jgi:tight adherence protein C